MKEVKVASELGRRASGGGLDGVGCWGVAYTISFAGEKMSRHFQHNNFPHEL